MPTYIGTIPIWLPTALDGTPLVSQGALSEPAHTNKFNNPLAPATQSITVTAVQHVLSFYGTGTITLSGTSTAGPLVGTGALNRVQLVFTPTAGSLTLTLSGSVTSPQLSINAMGVALSPALSASPTTTVAATILSSTGIPATGAWVQVVKWRAKLNSAQITTPQYLFGTYVDASNYTALIIDATTLTFRKRIAGVNYDATKLITVIAGTNYVALGRVNADNSTDIFHTGVKGTSNSNTTAPAIKAGGAYQIGSDGNGASQLYGGIIASELRAGVLSDAHCAYLTTL